MEKDTKEVPPAVKLQSELTELACRMVVELGLDRAVKMLRATLNTFKV
jgi:hypothetical protein